MKLNPKAAIAVLLTQSVLTVSIPIQNHLEVVLSVDDNNLAYESWHPSPTKVLPPTQVVEKTQSMPLADDPITAFFFEENPRTTPLLKPLKLDGKPTIIRKWNLT